MAKPVVLVVLDGWGIGIRDAVNPLSRASLPTFTKIDATYPLTSLEASGIAVGLPWGEVGNSEVGHLTLGAGRVLYQHYPRITLAIRDRTFETVDALEKTAAHLEKTGGRLHFAGLLSEGNVHAAIMHVVALADWAKQRGFADKTWFHVFGDGKDSPMQSMERLASKLPPNRIATAIGRHYAMDREENWSLTRSAYECMVNGVGIVTPDLAGQLAHLYSQNLPEEFLEPTVVNPEGTIKPGDAVVFWNFREDSIAQIAGCFVEAVTAGFAIQPIENLHVATMTAYRTGWTNPVLFPPDSVEVPLGRAIADAGLAQLRTAETYKHAHVTSFFNGYREEPFTGEYRVLIPSLDNPHPDEHPELVSAQITDRLELALAEKSFAFILANYANGDVIGHTGNFNAGVKAAEAVDAQLARLLPYAERGEVTLLITGDHGNIERMRDPLTGRPQTVHDINPVPFYLCDTNFVGKRFYNQDKLREETGGSLADVAPTVLALLGLPQPPEMTGLNLLTQLYGEVTRRE